MIKKHVAFCGLALLFTTLVSGHAGAFGELSRELTGEPSKNPPIKEGQGPDKVVSLRPLIVLVPGFFNSLSTEPDFADIITETINRRGLDVITVDNLLSIGTVEQNGARLDRFLTKTAERFPGRSMILLAHSAGGLYTLQALTNHPSLPVQTLVSIATPFRGIEFVDRLTSAVPGLDALAGYLDLDGIREFSSAKMAKAVAKFVIPPDLRVISLAGRQEPCLLLSCAQSEKLSWVLTVAQHLMSHSSDGVVTVGSALAEGLEFKRTNGERLEIEYWNDFVIPLEHWEIVQESRLFTLLGVVNIGHISRVQVHTFNTILDRLDDEISSSRPKRLSLPKL
jgi:pimeloyl-ACP methyl ester carboxylesterase